MVGNLAPYSLGDRIKLLSQLLARKFHASEIREQVMQGISVADRQRISELVDLAIANLRSS